MNGGLSETLRGLRKDPALAAILYEQLFAGRFWAMVANSDVPIESLFFLTYASSGGVSELPIFTKRASPVAERLAAGPTNPMFIELSGESLWPRMLDIVRTGQVEVAVDPGEEHGIRLTREAILGMVRKYGQPNASQ